MNTIKNEWESYKNCIDAPEHLQEVMKLTFYSGIFAIVRLQHLLREASHKEKIQLLKNWEAEVNSVMENAEATIEKINGQS